LSRKYFEEKFLQLKDRLLPGPVQDVTREVPSVVAVDGGLQVAS
jgi:hypothetical protein